MKVIKKTKITAIILTWNEEKHLSRCIDSLRGVATDILVVDSYSTDLTSEIALKKGATFLQNKWINYAAQFNWALTQIDSSCDWVLRIDADEILTPILAEEVQSKIGTLSNKIDGIYVARNMIFQGKKIKYGGLFPIKIIRFMRNGHGVCESRWMDEHIKVIGETIDFSGEIIDNNLNDLTWWTEKHNLYANREAIDLLNLEFNFMSHETIASIKNFKQSGLKRWLKENLYANFPIPLRSFFYFFYRYFIRFGFLDGQTGFTFHFLQGFWYRYLVDAKILEVKKVLKQKNISIEDAILEVLGKKV
jgi:glycosyltransferase involved in cell wall biosynthesis